MADASSARAVSIASCTSSKVSGSEPEGSGYRTGDVLLRGLDEETNGVRVCGNLIEFARIEHLLDYRFPLLPPGHRVEPSGCLVGKTSIVGDALTCCAKPSAAAFHSSARRTVAFTSRPSRSCARWAAS